MKRISVIVPCFNEEPVVEDTNERLVQVLSSIQGFEYEIIYVNDGSRDYTLNVLKELCRKNPKIKVVSFSRNFGHENATFAGLNEASGDCTVIIDADLQDPPELIPEMIKLWESGYEVVYAVRKIRKGETLIKKFTAKFFYRFLRMLSDTEIPLDTGDYRLIDKKVRIALASLKERNLFIRGLVSWVGFKQIGLEYHRNPRLKGETKYNLFKLTKLAIDSILAFSNRPLQLSLSFGFLFILVSLGGIVYIIIGKIKNPEIIVEGWASMMITILLLGGVQLLSIGILGEYIARIYSEVKGRPNYIIESKVNSEKDE